MHSESTAHSEVGGILYLKVLPSRSDAGKIAEALKHAEDLV